MASAHLDTFARDHLPDPADQPDFLFGSPELEFDAQLNCATELLDNHIQQGRGDRICLRAPGVTWTYADLYDKTNRIANVLSEQMGLVPGNRVLLRGPNNPMLVACWFAVIKAGGIAVATMPMLRAKELKAIIEIGQISHALCDARLAQELELAKGQCSNLAQTRYFNGESVDDLNHSMQAASNQFRAVNTASDDTCLLGFTSGTTGVPKATMHFHRDIIAACRCWPIHNLRATSDDVFIGSPPLAFTFGLGGLVLFPMAIGASTYLLEKAGPTELLDTIKTSEATVLFTSPLAYHHLSQHGPEIRQTKLRKCVSAGEALPASTRALWKTETGIEIIDGIGSTEMLHIFISHDESNARAGATGKPVYGYQAKIIDEQGNPLGPGVVGKLAVRGPTGCRYLADPRQRDYVQNGWNVTGDAYLMDEDGYFFYQARSDDMIVSSGYNIAAPEVEEALLLHPAVAECAVIGVPDAERGNIVKAFVVLTEGSSPDEKTVKTLQDFVKATVAPYKYPRAIEFIDALPRTATGKVQRFKLKQLS